jgi:hypothetical protein
MATTLQHSRARQLAGSLAVPHGEHICMLYRESDEQFRTIAGFFAAALRDRHKLLYITDANPADEVRRRFAELGVDLGEASGAEVRTTIESYHPEGRFEPEAMLAQLEDYAARATRQGFAGCRCTGEMGWASRKIPGAERLIEYEVLLTDVIERLPFSGICQYDVRLFDGPTILAVLEVHPFLLVRGQILRNPNFVRRTAAEAAASRIARDDRPRV